MAAGIGNRIREARRALGITQKTLARQLRVCDKTVSNWEHEVTTPREIVELAEVVKVSVAWLKNGDSMPSDADRICRLLEGIVEHLRLLRLDLIDSARLSIEP